MADKSEQVVTSQHHRSSPKLSNSTVRSNSAYSKTAKVDSAVEVLRKNLHKQQQQQQQKSNKSSLTTMCDEEDEEFLDEEDEELDGQPDDDNLSSGLPSEGIKKLLNAFSSGSYNGSSAIDDATLSAMFKAFKNAPTAGGQSVTTNTITNSALLNNNNLETFSSMAASPCNSQTSNRHSSPVSNISNSANNLSLNRADSATANSMNNSHSFAQLSSPVSSNCTTPMSVISTTTTTSNVPGRNKVFECKTCNRKFGYKHVLQNHERIHTGEKPFSCHICKKKFTRDHHLKTHYRLHTGEKPFECEHCTKRFVQIANLRRHLRTHTGERPYACEIPNCDSRFSDSNQLKAHMLIHLNQKPYKCDKCQGFYRRRHHLIHHKCPMDESNLGKPRRGRRPRAYESQNTLLPMDVHLSGNSLNNSLNNSSSNNSSTNNLNNLSTNSMNNSSLINSNNLQAINSSTGNNLLDALSIQTAGHLANNNVSSKIQNQAAAAANSLFNSLTGNHNDLLANQLGNNLSNNLLNSLFGQALGAADANSASSNGLEELVRSNKLNQLALSNLIKNNNASQNAQQSLQAQQIEQLTRNLNGLNQNKSTAAANNMADLLNSNNLVNSLQQQQLMTALALTNLNSINALGNLGNLGNLNALGNLNNNLNNNLNSNLNASLQSYLQNAMQMAPLDFSSTNSTKKNSTSNHRNKSHSNALDLSQVKQEQRLNEMDDELEEKDDEESNLLLVKEQLKNLNKFNQLGGHQLLLSHQLQMLNSLNRSNSQEDSMSVDEDCFESEEKIGVNNNNSKRNKNLNNKASPKSINNNSLSSLNKNHDPLMDCDLVGRGELNGGLRGKSKSPVNSAKDSIKEDQLSSLSKEELEMLLRKQFNNNNPLPSDAQFDQSEELSNALRNLIPSHLLQQKQSFNSGLHSLSQQIGSNEHDLLTSINNLSNNSNNSGGNSPKNISSRNQLRRHMDHNANETVSTIVANAAK